MSLSGGLWKPWNKRAKFEFIFQNSDFILAILTLSHNSDTKNQLVNLSFEFISLTSGFFPPLRMDKLAIVELNRVIKSEI